MALTAAIVNNALPTISAIATDRFKQYLDGLKCGRGCETNLEESEYLFAIADALKYWNINDTDADKCLTDEEVELLINIALSYGSQPCSFYSQPS